MRNLGVVYVLVNSVFENYVKIGRTTNLERRLRSLDNTSVPLPFRCVFAVEVMMKTRWSVCCIKRLRTTEQKPHENFFS